jgi:hypothetical protein
MQVSAFSFVQFSGGKEVVPFGQAGDLSFQVVSEVPVNRVGLVDLDGITVISSGEGIHSTGNVYDITLSFDEYPECFRIALFNGAIVLGVSSTVFVLTNSRYICNINYLCDDDSFDFAYCETGFVNRVCLPLRLKEPQFPQEQKVYEKRDGRRKLLSASISKEWEVETDYLSEGMHEKLIVALAHDNIYINGRLLTKTGNYSIDYGSILERDGIEYMKASCKVSANVTHRNSNCGNSCAAEGVAFDVQPRTVVFR